MTGFLWPTFVADTCKYWSQWIICEACEVLIWSWNSKLGNQIFPIIWAILTILASIRFSRYFFCKQWIKINKSMFECSKTQSKSTSKLQMIKSFTGNQADSLSTMAFWVRPAQVWLVPGWGINQIVPKNQTVAISAVE